MSAKDVSAAVDPSVLALLRRVENGDIEIVAPVDLARLGATLTGDGRTAEILARHAYRAPHAVFIGWSERIWHYSQARAIAMRLLAERSQSNAMVSPGVAYAAGLLADVGASYLLRWWAAGTFGAPPLGDHTLGRIEASVRTHHEAAGAALLSRWGLDPLTVHLSRNHHTERPREENPYWVLGVIADLLARNAAADPDLTYAAPLSAAVREACCDAVRISPADLRRMAVRVRLEFQAARITLDESASADARDLLSLRQGAPARG